MGRNEATAAMAVICFCGATMLVSPERLGGIALAVMSLTAGWIIFRFRIAIVGSDG